MGLHARGRGRGRRRSSRCSRCFGASTFTTFDVAASTFVFDAALVVLLLHPMSRDYQRIWFR